MFVPQPFRKYLVSCVVEGFKQYEQGIEPCPKLPLFIMNPTAYPEWVTDLLELHGITDMSDETVWGPMPAKPPHVEHGKRAFFG
jgi:hypothetical protein